MKKSKISHLNEWVQLYTDDLYSWAKYKLSDVELAKDLVQDTFVTAVEKYEGFKAESSPKTWLFSILNHKIIDYYRKKVKQPISKDIESFSGFFEKNGDWLENRKPKNWQLDEREKHLLDDINFQKVLKKCLDSLPEKWGTCVKLKYLAAKNGEQICQELDISPSNFWQIVYRAKLQLRDCVEKNWFNS
ncbi:MAG: sigma-70 family RNA polymerase sigma factor [Prolixibacteraceae bacterium]|jgi:RNA polymerase sigma-70 factor (TIGR02943 family)|nr:sigma-70 family RNA polymerase sigma factor [Prolixibacteraceae bacterium]MBT6004121.1 sigma-70 family RNA polymerase sigma factor [Prolixibacteraceae bacterium]MBT6763465.1 sigma-70 family RNA polymerase sigma factor [Prolixibacteraceae bacterium]MBT6996886.1 sigma-70 family RNA polymerase sigma factor [Prolixibacteraceae bacterium]MBT7394352.1 sigma-70 family RNA polymerase sigma factor [Prolixibacteraceae bacterium]